MTKQIDPTKAIAERLCACGCPRAVVDRHVKALEAIRKKRSKQEMRQFDKRRYLIANSH